MSGTSTYFESHHELACLPYFATEAGGRLLLREEHGPAIDAHTHLALAFLLPLQVDLEREHPRTEHYLGLDDPVELDRYANQNFSAAALRRMKLDLTLLSATGRGMRRTHTAPNLLREMRELRIRSAVLHAIDLPAISDNASAYLEVGRRHPELLVFGSVHPLAPAMARRLDAQLARGARGVKLHPATQLIRPDHPRAMELYRLCGERRAPVFFHCGPVGIEPAAGRRRSQVRLYEAPIREHPQTTFVLGHAGALQFDEALALARRYENVWLESASQSLGVVRRIAREAPGERIMFGSDWPFYSQAMSIAKVLIATEGDRALRRRFLLDNAARLLGLEEP
jgi:predicted TIM-barrel fold metal-dependent hydrolase